MVAQPLTADRQMRSTLFKIFKGVGCASVILCAVIIAPGIVLGMALSAGSVRSVYQRATSPDGWYDARVQFDDGGAISPFSRLVFVKHHWNPSEEPLLSCRAFWADGEEPVYLSWINNNTLLIQHGFQSSDVESVEDHCGPVHIIVKKQ